MYNCGTLCEQIYCHGFYQEVVIAASMYYVVTGLFCCLFSLSKDKSVDSRRTRSSTTNQLDTKQLLTVSVGIC